MPADQAAPIIIKKIKKGGHGGHHGGAWKIAYADFVTAMMAFFLLLWLLNSVTQEQLEGIADYFTPTVASTSQSGSGDILGGTTISQDGTKSDDLTRPTVTMDLPPPSAGAGGQALEEAPTDPDAEPVDNPEDLSQKEVDPEAVAAAEAAVAQEKAEEEQFDQAQKELQEAIENLPELKQLADSLLIDNTPEGLRIQIVDQDGLAMFASGSANLFEHTERVLALVAKVILKMPQQISISGHTDSVPFTSRGDSYTNWELSADRANSSRRFLVQEGVPAGRLARVVGKAETEPLLVEDPANARNRRLSIVMLRGTGEQPAPETAPDAAGEPNTEPDVTPPAKTGSGVKTETLILPEGGIAPAAEPEPEVVPKPEPEPEPEVVPEPAPEPEPEVAPAPDNGAKKGVKTEILILPEADGASAQ